MKSKSITVFKPWGRYEIIDKKPRFWIKKLFINQGERLSLQSHQYRDEYWLVLDGKIKAINGPDQLILSPGEQLKVNKGVKHRIVGLTNACVVEIALGLVKETDIIRYQDEYGRK